MAGGGSLKYSLPPGVQQSLSQSDAILQQELQRLQGLSGAITADVLPQYSLMGFNPSTNEPYVQSMLNTLLSGGQIDPSQYTVSSTTPASSLAPNPGPRPIDYRTEFAQKGYKNWGKNDVAAEQRRNAEIADWEQKNAVYQKSVAQQQAARTNTSQIPGYDIYRAQAEQELQRYQQVQAQNEQIKAQNLQIQSRNEQVKRQTAALQEFQNQAVARARDTSGIDTLRNTLQGQLETAPVGWAEALSNLGTYESQLQDALNRPDAEWQRQFDTSQQQAIQYQDYLQRVLSGTEPIDPAVGRLAEQRKGETQNQLYHQLGPGWETSSAGIEWMNRLNQATQESQFSERQRMLSQGLANYQGAIGATNTLQQQRNDVVNQALGRYTQGISNIGTLGDIRQREVAGNLNALQAMYGNQYNAIQAAMATEPYNAMMPNVQSSDLANQFNYNQSLAAALQNLTAMPYSQSLMPLVQGYQQQAQSYGQNAVARQPNPSLLQQISPILGQAAGAGLGAFAGGIGAGAGAGIGASLGSWLGGGGQGTGGGYQMGQPQWNWMS